MSAIAVLAFPLLGFGIVLAYLNLTKPDVKEEHYAAGQELWRRGQLLEAIAEFNEAIKVDPSSVEALTRRGDAYYALGELYQALLDYDESISFRATLVSDLVKPGYSAMKEAVANAYAGRALVNTSLGNDMDAQRDMAAAIDMGYDAAPARQAIEDLKAQR